MKVEYSLKQIADIVGGQLSGHAEKRICGVAPFEMATSDQITFAAGSKYLKNIVSVNAGAVIVPQAIASRSDLNLIVTDNPQLAFAKVVGLFQPEHRPVAKIDDRAWIGTDVQLTDNVYIGPFASIGDRSAIGTHTFIHHGVYIGNDVIIGDETVIFPNVTIMNGCRIGNRVTIHPGTVIGSDGYGFVQDDGKHHKIPQIGIVQIDDDVEIGAGNTIDRATFGRTWIKRGVKTDNLVHIAHNVVVGEDSLIVAQVGIAGSTQIGHHAILAGQAGISGHLTIGNHVTVGPMTGVGKDIEDGQVVSSGSPSMPHRTWLRVQRVIPNLPEMKKKIADLEKKIADLESLLDKR
ncbi:LpxD: UDP-3-O-[3-hydroxymyristoyl] glucosamine N-acyltransferase [Desulfosarcina variabilis str. Montpellier]|uniref:UDP-3-O-(3-hydroxymyristoyl)glucosamine N-acyltransferase n=1 Tax=Desulfosarcina variabilis TaxID=2300 RepID=UPI003AFA9701